MAKLKTTDPYSNDFFEDPKRPSDTAGIAQTPGPPAGKPVRFNIELDRGIHRDFKMLCLKQDRDMAEVVRSFLAQAVTSGTLPPKGPAR